MCGLVGIAGDLTLKDEVTIKKLIFYDYFRGQDATGFAAIRKATKEAKIAKISSHMLNLFDLGRFKDALSAYSSYVFMGHNRAATRGERIDANAHPFHCGHIIGAHNGTLDYLSQKRLEDAVGEKFGVDSEAIFAAIAKLGLEETIELMTEGKTSTDGAWSLVWFDQLDGTLNFLRNKHRPLWYCFEKGFKKIFWGSDYEIIHSALVGDASYDLYEEGKEKFKYFSTEADVHYKFDVDALREGGEKRPKAKAKTIKGREPIEVVTSASDNPFFRDTAVGFGNHTSMMSRSQKPIIHLIGDVINPLAGYLQRDEFELLSKYGCSFCRESIEFIDTGLTIFESDHTILCPLCSGNARNKDVPSSTRIHVNAKTIASMQ